MSILILRQTGIPDALGDWNNRRTAPGVTFACDFSGPNDFTLANVNGGTGRVWAPGMNAAKLANVIKDVTDGLTNGCCLKINKPAAEDDLISGSAEWLHPLSSSFAANSDSFGLGVPFYYQWRQKIPSDTWFVPSDCGGNQQARKVLLLCQYSPTNTAGQSFANTPSQHVITEQDGLRLPQAYHRNTAGTSYPQFMGSPGGLSGGGVFKTVQNAVDRGAGFPNHADRYCEVPSPFDTASPGCFRWPADEWFTMMVRVKPASYTGGPGNEFDMWIARAGVYTWTHLIHEVDYELGDPNDSGGGFTGINGGHLTTYESQRLGSTVDTYTKFDQILVSLNEPSIPRDSGVPA